MALFPHSDPNLNKNSEVKEISFLTTSFFQFENYIHKPHIKWSKKKCIYPLKNGQNNNEQQNTTFHIILFLQNSATYNLILGMSMY